MTAEVLNLIQVLAMICMAGTCLYVNWRTFKYLLDCEGVLYRIEKARHGRPRG
jgi:hypothetical protein